jgi:hypothetical protein
VAVAAGASLAGLVLLLLLVAPPQLPAPATPGTLAAGFLTLQIQTTTWIVHDDVGGPLPTGVPDGFQMPASMMPGMPDHGTHRLYVEAEISDTGQAAASFAPADFSARSPGGRSWPLNKPPSFSAEALGPGQERSLDLFFDMPETVDASDLVWTHDGLIQSMPIDSRPPPPHVHE